MADSILRLRVDSQEYDNKLKRAAEGIQRYAENCKKAGGTLEYLDEGVLEFTRALGGMETTARGASARLSELKKTFTDLSAQYNKLTEEEKQSPFGKALSESLDRLKIRIQDGSSEIKNINDTLAMLKLQKSLAKIGDGDDDSSDDSLNGWDIRP